MNQESGIANDPPQARGSGDASAHLPLPGYKVFDSTSIALATFFGSPVAGGGLMALNYRRMGNRTGASLALACGVAVTAAAIGAGYLIPSYATSAVAVMLVVAMKNTAKALQGNAIEEHVRLGGRLSSRWAASGFGLALLAVIFGGIVTVLLMHDSETKLAVGTNDAIYYSGSASKQDAVTLGDALKKIGYFRDTGANILYSRGIDGNTVSFVVKDGVWKQPELITAFQEIGRAIAPAVGGLPIKIRLVNSARETMKEFDLEKVLAGEKTAS